MAKTVAFAEIDGSQLKIGIVVARWNQEYTFALRDEVVRALKDSKVAKKNILVQEVPGSFELVYGASSIIQRHDVDAVVCIGVLIKGDTLHFEHVAQAVAHGIADINARGDVPVIFGVLPCLNEAQVKPRAARTTGYGYGWGKSVVEMALLKKSRPGRD